MHSWSLTYVRESNCKDELEAYRVSLASLHTGVATNAAQTRNLLGEGPHYNAVNVYTVQQSLVQCSEALYSATSLITVHQSLQCSECLHNAVQLCLRLPAVQMYGKYASSNACYIHHKTFSPVCRARVSHLARRKTSCKACNPVLALTCHASHGKAEVTAEQESLCCLCAQIEHLFRNAPSTQVCRSMTKKVLAIIKS